MATARRCPTLEILGGEEVCSTTLKAATVPVVGPPAVASVEHEDLETINLLNITNASLETKPGGRTHSSFINSLGMTNLGFCKS